MLLFLDVSHLGIYGLLDIGGTYPFLCHLFPKGCLQDSRYEKFKTN